MEYVITPGEKIAILMPSVFFIVLIIIKSVSDARLAYELKKKLKLENESTISEVIGPNLYLGYFFDYLILAITNGLSLILVLNQIEIGIIQLLVGIIASILGIVYLDADKDLIAQKIYGKTITERIFAFCYYFTFAQTGYFFFFDIQLLSLNVIFSPWIGFIAFFVVAYLFDKGFTSAMRSRMP
jgi:hypothetical protein